MSAEPRKSLVHRTALFLVWLGVALAAVVFSEPAPFDLIMMGLIVLLPVIGLAPLSPALVLFLALWLLVSAGGVASTITAGDLHKAGTHTFITLYLSIAALVIAAFVRRSPVRHTRIVMGAMIAASLVAAVSGLVGYFGVVPSLQDLFTEFGRARGTFKDPNVFGAFLVLPATYAVHLFVSRRGLSSFVALVMLGLLSLATLLSFSRGAWFSLALAFLAFGYLSFVTAETAKQRLRIFLLAFFGVIGMSAVILGATQVDSVRTLLAERATLTQSYDEGPEGRFGGQEKARSLITEHPFGIGALEFSRVYHHEDVHNVYLSMFLNAGWLGGGMYLVLVVMTILVGLKGVFRRTAFQSLAIVAFAAFFSTAAEGLIIDTDHWRHFFVLMGLVWGTALAAGRASQLDGPSEGLAEPAQTRSRPVVVGQVEGKIRRKRAVIAKRITRERPAIVPASSPLERPQSPLPRDRRPLPLPGRHRATFGEGESLVLVRRSAFGRGPGSGPSRKPQRMMRRFAARPGKLRAA
ncbi:MAG: hypothetical protein R3D33_18320 [Hyphomicrobiaceae bacterium]